MNELNVFFLHTNQPTDIFIKALSIHHFIFHHTKFKSKTNTLATSQQPIKPKEKWWHDVHTRGKKDNIAVPSQSLNKQSKQERNDSMDDVYTSGSEDASNKFNSKTNTLATSQN